MSLLQSLARRVAGPDPELAELKRFVRQFFAADEQLRASSNAGDQFQIQYIQAWENRAAAAREMVKLSEVKKV